MPNLRLVLIVDGEVLPTEVYYGDKEWALTNVLNLETNNARRGALGTKTEFRIVDINTDRAYKVYRGINEDPCLIRTNNPICDAGESIVKQSPEAGNNGV